MSKSSTIFAASCALLSLFSGSAFHSTHLPGRHRNRRRSIRER